MIRKTVRYWVDVDITAKDETDLNRLILTTRKSIGFDTRFTKGIPVEVHDDSMTVQFARTFEVKDQE